VNINSVFSILQVHIILFDFTSIITFLRIRTHLVTIFIHLTFFFRLFNNSWVTLISAPCSFCRSLDIRLRSHWGITTKFIRWSLAFSWCTTFIISKRPSFTSGGHNFFTWCLAGRDRKFSSPSSFSRSWSITWNVRLIFTLIRWIRQGFTLIESSSSLVLLLLLIRLFSWQSVFFIFKVLIYSHSYNWLFLCWSNLSLTLAYLLIITDIRAAFRLLFALKFLSSAWKRVPIFVWVIVVWFRDWFGRRCLHTIFARSLARHCLSTRALHRTCSLESSFSNLWNRLKTRRLKWCSFFIWLSSLRLSNLRWGFFLSWNSYFRQELYFTINNWIDHIWTVVIKSVP